MSRVEGRSKDDCPCDEDYEGKSCGIDEQPD